MENVQHKAKSFETQKMELIKNYSVLEIEKMVSFYQFSALPLDNETVEYLRNWKVEFSTINSIHDAKELALVNDDTTYQRRYESL